jgi:hypothetical protein
VQPELIEADLERGALGAQQLSWQWRIVEQAALRDWEWLKRIRGRVDLRRKVQR